jgi:hypothetical protein
LLIDGGICGRDLVYWTQVDMFAMEEVTVVVVVVTVLEYG